MAYMAYMARDGSNDEANDLTSNTETVDYGTNSLTMTTVEFIDCNPYYPVYIPRCPVKPVKDETQEKILTVLKRIEKHLEYERMTPEERRKQFDEILERHLNKFKEAYEELAKK